LHGLYKGFPSPTLLLFFSVTLFASHTHIRHIAFSEKEKSKEPPIPQAKSRWALQPPPPCPLVPEKNNPTLFKHNVALWKQSHKAALR
jgi:hypothetical protein